jgi:hypothetical protein
MKTLNSILVCSALILVIVGYFGPVWAQPTEFIPGILNESGLPGIRLMQHGTGGYGYGEGFDREGCEADCRDQFGISPYAWGFGDRTPGYYAYARCIQGCENSFWKDFDRRTRQLEKE